MRSVSIILCLLAMPVQAQEYQTPSDYAPVEAYLTAELHQCFRQTRSYHGDLACGNQLYNACTRIAPDGDTTAGLAICGGVLSNVLDRSLNDVWADLRRGMSPADFEGLLGEQRNWLAYRTSESKAATQRNAGGSMSAYSGWIKYVDLSAERLARLREMARE